MLDGRLLDYGLFDVLQIAATRPGASRLRVDGPDATVEMRIVDGALVGVQELDRPRGAYVMARLRGLGLVDEAALGRALARSAQTGRALAEVVAGDGSLQAQLADIERWRQTDCMLAPFTWEDGAYTWTVDDPESGASPEVAPDAVGIDRLIRRGLELRDAWPQVRRWVPAWDLVVERRLPIPPPALHGETGARALDAALDEAVWRRAEVGSTAAQIADRVPAARIHARRALARLVARGGLEWAPRAA